MTAAFFLYSSPLIAQNPQLGTKSGQRFPTVVFTSARWDSNPSYYSIAIDSSGAATYQSAPDSVDTTGVPYTVVFQASDATRRTVFALVRSLNFFRDELPLSVGSAQNGVVNTFSYHDTTFNNQITYTDSTSSQLEELTSIVVDISATFEFGRRLANFRDQNKSAIGKELEAMQKDAQRHHLREVQAVAPVLKSIASDQTIEAAVRDRAVAILNSSNRAPGFTTRATGE